jgi:hypothetical protein
MGYSRLRKPRNARTDLTLLQTQRQCVEVAGLAAVLEERGEAARLEAKEALVRLWPLQKSSRKPRNSIVNSQFERPSSHYGEESGSEACSQGDPDYLWQSL